MPSSIVDIIIVLFLLLGAIIGFKRGVIKSATMFIGSIVVVILAYALKNPVSKLMYTYLPFFHLNGAFEGVTVINILIYEAIAFLIVFSILMALLRILIKMTGIIETFLKFTIILGIPSKILGAIFGLLEEFLYIFVILYFLSHLTFTASYIEESKLGSSILYHTPVLSNVIETSMKSFEEIYGLKEKYNNTTNKDAYNKEAFEILLKYSVITPESAKKLIELKKIDIDNADELIKRYEVLK